MGFFLQRGYVVCLCLFVRQLDHSESCQRILVNFFPCVCVCGMCDRQLDFDGDRIADPGII